jgi:uncharacterized protein YeaO (DUF488 family)
MGINEKCLSDLRRQKGEQVSISESFKENPKEYTKIAVVRKPMYGIKKETDEHNKDLSPPIELLEDFWEQKEDMSHNEAWEEVNFEERYLEYIKNNPAVESIIQRLRDGENITLVCYEKKPKKCHRHILKRRIENKV